jgi:spore coat protein CotH
MIGAMFLRWLERPRDPRPIALLRITLFFGVIVHFGPALLAHDVEFAHTAVRARLHNGWLYDHLEQVPRAVVGVFALALVASAASAACGFRVRFASAATMLLSWVFASWNALPVQTIALLCAWSLIPVYAVLPGSASTWSIDAWLAKKQGRTLEPPGAVASVAWFLVVWPVFFAGIEKIVSGWLQRNEMAMLFRTPPGYILRDVTFALPLQQEWLSQAIGWGTVFVELTAPTLLLFRRTRAVGLFLWVSLFLGIVALIEVPPLFFAIFFFGVFLSLETDELDAASRFCRRLVGRNVASGAVALICAVVAASASSGCLKDAASPAIDPTASWFRHDALLPIEIALSEQRLDELRHEHHEVAAVATSLCEGHPPVDVHRWHEADVRVDGVVHEAAAVRKKGFFGSDDVEKPSLKVKWRDPGDNDDTVLTLNNGVADPSLIRQCLASLVFERAGVLAPRCGFARVVLNGVDHGVYVHIESMKRPFLARLTSDEGVTLYEGRLADLRAEMRGLFEGKDVFGTAPDPAVDPVLGAITLALDGPDDTLLPALAEVLDLEAFARFWAVEVLVGHVDGYANNRNNFFLWYGPSDARLRFIPWGLDETFEDRGTLQAPASPAASVMARGRLARRLSLHPEGRLLLETALSEVLDDAWDEAVLVAAIDEMADLLRTHTGGDVWRDIERGIARTRAFVVSRRAVLEAERALPVVWSEPERPPVCQREGPLSASVRTTTRTLQADPFVVGDGESDPPFARVGARAGQDREGRLVLELALDDGGPAFRAIRVVAPWSALQAGASLPLSGERADATALLLDVTKDDGQVRPDGVLVDGALMIDDVDADGDTHVISARVFGVVGRVLMLGD